ncbi:MAG: baseplate J/gp47 family protein [Alphaproteobacteria bacterium]|nr:baseplate J/gp47 family protein [Alphaproteobacteria bacterium]
MVGQILLLAAFYADLANLSDLVMLDTTTDEYLDLRVAERGIERQSATPAKYNVTIVGALPEEGTRFFANDMYFALFYEGSTPYLESEEPGTSGNVVENGTAASPVDTVEGLASATFGSLLEPGTNEETDESLRERNKESITGPAENGNKQHYKTWCESVSGVGYARIIPLWNGPNTVKGIITDDDGMPASEMVVARVQEYIDPDSDGDGEGDGLGEGVANIGAKFTAVAPTSLSMNVSVIISLASGATLPDVKQELETKITQYLKDLVLNSTEDERPIIRYNQIGSIILDTEGVLDYSDLRVNDGTANIQPDYDVVGVMGTVTVTSAS